MRTMVGNSYGFLGSVAVVAFVAGCSSAGTRHELDARTGVSWTAERDAVAFARTETRYSRSARDYVYLGPVEINRRGSREYLIWVGFGTTLDRGYLAPEIVVPDRLVLEVRGEPIELELLPWTERAPELAGVSVYSPSVDLVAALAGRVTLDQLRLLAAEEPESVRLAGEGGPTVEYFRWRDWSGWAAFIAEAGELVGRAN
jgi:hypothetical protein